LILFVWAREKKGEKRMGERYIGGTQNALFLSSGHVMSCHTLQRKEEKKG
jgi:hypothetical protein